MRIGFICFVLVSWLCFGSTHGRSHEHLKHTKNEIHASQILTKSHDDESKLNVEKETTNSNEDLIKEIASPKDASEIQKNVTIKTILTENDSVVQENGVNKIVIVHNVTNQNQQQPLEGKEKVKKEKKQLKQHLPEDEILKNEQLNGEKLQTEQQQQKKTENQTDQSQVNQEEEQQQVEKENQRHQKQEQEESQDQKQEGEEEQNSINQEQKQDPQEQLEEEKKVEEEQQEQSKQQHQQQLDKQQKQVKQEKEDQQQQQVSDNTDVVLNKQEHENKIAVSMKKEENHPINDKPNIKRQNIDLYEVDKPMKKEQKEKNASSNSENEIKLSSSANTSSDYLDPKNEQMLKINDDKTENLNRNEDVKENKLTEQNANPKSEKDQHQKIKSKHNNKNVSKEQVKKQILHPLAEAKNTFHKNSKVEPMKNTTINNRNNELNMKTDNHNTSETNQDKKKATENNTEPKVTKTDLLEKLTVHKTENNQSDHYKVLNKLKDDKSTINDSKLHNKNKSRVSFSHHREEHINKDQGPEKMKDVIQSKSSTQKSSDPKQNTKKEIMTKEETSNMKQNEKHENELVIKLRNELDEEEDKYLEKKKENHAKISTTQKHKKKYSTAIITVSLTLIISTVLLSIAGIYYSKISLDGRRYYGHTLLPTEEDISLYTRTNYNDDVDRYESWNSS